jgi:uncharacterized protein (DUF305 family)
MSILFRFLLAALLAALPLSGASAFRTHHKHANPGTTSGITAPKKTEAAQPGSDAYDSSLYEAAAVNMHRGMVMNYTGDPDTDFVRGMIPHHKAALEMAEVELKYGRDPQVKKLAAYIRSAQANEIDVMQRWLDRRGTKQPVGNAVEVRNMPYVLETQKNLQNMHHAMMVQYTGDPDTDFLLGMIPHHQGAVDMAATELHNGKDAEVRKFADDVFSSQQQQIGQMRSWLKDKKQQ